MLKGNDTTGEGNLYKLGLSGDSTTAKYADKDIGTQSHSVTTTTTDWVNEKKPPVKIAYNVENQQFTFEGDGSIIGPSQSSKFFSFSIFGSITNSS